MEKGGSKLIRRTHSINLSQNISVTLRTIGITMAWLLYGLGYRLDNRGTAVRFLAGVRVFFSPKRRDRLWELPSLLVKGHWRRLTRA